MAYPAHFTKLLLCNILRICYCKIRIIGQQIHFSSPFWWSPTAEKTNDSQKCGLSYFLSFIHFCSHFSENAKAPATPVFLVSNTQKVLIFQRVQGIVTTVYCFDVTPKWNSFEITRNLSQIRSFRPWDSLCFQVFPRVRLLKVRVVLARSSCILARLWKVNMEGYRSGHNENDSKSCYVPRKLNNY